MIFPLRSNTCKLSKIICSENDGQRECFWNSKMLE